METIFFIIVVFVLNFIYLMKSNHNKEYFQNKEDFQNNYDFIAIISDWGNIYSKYQYNNKSLAELDNKYNSYKMCKDLRIPTPKLYHYGNFDNIKKNIYNKRAFVIKPLQECSSNNVFPLVKKNNKFINEFDSKEVTKQQLKDTFKNKKVIVEEFIKNDDGEYAIPDDYKIYCFKGNIEFILHKYYKDGKYYSFYYNKDWKPLDIKTNNFSKGEAQPRPRKFLKMIDYCRIIAGKVFPDVFVRLDFYFNNTDPVFGEVTPSPNGGKGFKDQKTRNFLNYLCQKNDLSL